MARVTGLEPAASGVTGRRSNQLSYTRALDIHEVITNETVYKTIRCASQQFIQRNLKKLQNKVFWV